MEITFLGQAGLFFETRHGSVLCDPWFNTAYFASWFPFPSNEQIDLGKISKPTYLYVSHLHHDHFDPQFLREHVSKDTTVLLPDYPLDLLERALRDVGFTKFLRTKNGQMHEIDGLKVMIMAAVAPTDGPLGDSGILLDDGETRIFDQNDSRPVDLDLLASYGPYDAHFLQFSGAIWYPMVYQFPEKMRLALGRKKRENEMSRALRYAQQLGASYVIPSAGPPCFLDDALFGFNDFDRDPTNTFPDQTVFIEHLQAHGMDNGRLMIPGSVASLSKTACDVRHPVPDDELGKIFTEKRAYLTAYQARQQARIDVEKASWPRHQVDILAELQEWFNPLLAQADQFSVGVNGLVVMRFVAGELGSEQAQTGETVEVVLDFHQREVRAWAGEEWDYRLTMDRALVEYCILHHVEDWINTIFLSCRFEAERRGAYNEYVYNFFKCLTPERLQYAEAYYAEKSSVDQFFETHGYRIQRRCPHLKADLTRFGKIEDGVLTCTMHGWQFELATGRCLTSDDRRLFSQPLTGDEANHADQADHANHAETPAATTIQTAGATQHTTTSAEPTHIAPLALTETPLAPLAAGAPQVDSVQMPTKCGHCWYNPADLPAKKDKA